MSLYDGHTINIIVDEKEFMPILGKMWIDENGLNFEMDEERWDSKKQSSTEKNGEGPTSTQDHLTTPAETTEIAPGASVTEQ